MKEGKTIKIAWKGFAKKAVLLLAIGAALALILWGSRGGEGLVLLSDWLFAEASVFLVAGLVEWLCNMHMFTSASWGMKTVKRIFRNEKTDGRDYIAYRQSRKTHADAPVLLLAAALLAVLSLAAGLLA